MASTHPRIVMATISRFVAAPERADFRFKRKNDTVYFVPSLDNIVWTYHGNAIARRNVQTGDVICSLAGWPTLTTMTRLNCLCEEYHCTRFFRGYGTSRYDAHPTFGGQDIDPDDWFSLTHAPAPRHIHIPAATYPGDNSILL